MKVVINDRFGGYGLSDNAIARYAELKGINLVPIDHHDHLSDHGWYNWYLDGVKDSAHWFDEDSIPRDDPALVQTVEELGEDSFGFLAKLKVVEIPDDVDWYVAEYDGKERVAERHRTW